MSKPNRGDFPVCPIGPGVNHENLGLSIREYFAASMAQGMWSNPESIVALAKVCELEGMTSNGSENIARLAVRAADALIVELSKEVK